VAADDLELHDNRVAYTGADAAGVSIAINDAGASGACGRTRTGGRRTTPSRGTWRSTAAA
jgi:hypothetical protein